MVGSNGGGSLGVQEEEEEEEGKGAHGEREEEEKTGRGVCLARGRRQCLVQLTTTLVQLSTTWRGVVCWARGRRGWFPSLAGRRSTCLLYFRVQGLV